MGMCIKGVGAGHNKDGMEVDGSTSTTGGGAADDAGRCGGRGGVGWGGDHDPYPITTYELSCHHPDHTKRTTCLLLQSEVTRKGSTLGAAWAQSCLSF